MKIKIPKNKNLPGFTLIELLVVMSIILMLSLLVYPVVMKGIEKGQQVQCMGNLRQIGCAFQMYITDYNTLPYAKRHTYADDPKSIVKVLSGYLDNPFCYICKSTEEPFQEQYRLSYVYNISGDIVDSPHQIGRPARSVVVSNSDEVWVLVDARSPKAPNPHFNFANSLWLDGHIEATKADK